MVSHFKLCSTHFDFPIFSVYIKKCIFIFLGKFTFHKRHSLKRLNNGPKVVFQSEMSRLAKVLRNRLIRLGRRKSRIYISEEPNEEERIKVRKLITDLERQGPSGIVHLNFLSRAIKRNIRISRPKKNLTLVIGKKGLKQPPLEIDYHEPGHWTKKGNENPNCDSSGLNNCLFEAVASQINRTSAEIRSLTLREMKINKKEIARQVAVMEELETIDPSELWIGGAKYNGKSAKDAKKILDDSQNGTCHPNNKKGHPRGHASHPSAKGETDSVENYSAGGWKTGFLSRSDQDFVTHLALDSDPGQERMEDLNEGFESIVLEIKARELEYDDLPLANEYRNGKALGKPERFRTVKAVLRHHSGKFKNTNANVFVYTLYPTL